jgi:hypothetical protein
MIDDMFSYAEIRCDRQDASFSEAGKHQLALGLSALDHRMRLRDVTAVEASGAAAAVQA